MTAVAAGRHGGPGPDQMELQPAGRADSGDDGPGRLLLRTTTYDVFLDGDTVEVVFTAPFDTSAAPGLRSILTLARDMGMNVRARVRSNGETGPGTEG